MNTTLFLDINRFAAKTVFLHGVLGALASRVGLVVLAGLLVLGLAEARLGRWRPRPGVGASLWLLVAVGVSVGVGELAGRVLDRPRPAQSLHGIEVIGTPASGFSLPDLRIAAAAAICIGLLALGSRIIGLLGVLVVLLVGFTEIYVGAHYPLDELAGLALGAVVALLGVPLFRRSTAPAATTHRPRSLTAELAGLGRAGTLAHAGPAATPVPLAATGSVRLLEAPSGGEVGSLPPPRLAALQPVEWLHGTAPGAGGGAAEKGPGAGGVAGATEPARQTSAAPAPAGPASAPPAPAGAATAKAGPLPGSGSGASSSEQVATIAVFPRPPGSASPN